MLIFIPVIHPNDEVAFKTIMQGIPIKMKKQSIIDKLWKKIDRWLDARLEELNVDYRKIKVYQDGMDGAPTEELLLFGAKFSKNWKLTLKLYKKGAKIMKTENLQLLDEQQRLKNMSWSKMKEISDRRDRYIAKIIGNTLDEGELGILIMGVGHDVQRFLPSDINIEYGFFTREIYETLHKYFS
jgi:hypothetical protein